MRLVFVCFYEAYPPTSGAASVSYNAAKYAHGESYLLQMGYQDREELTGDYVTVITFKGDSNRRIEKIYNLRHSLVRIIKTIKTLSPEAVILEGASWVMYHWLLLREIRSSCLDIKIVYHSHNVEYLLRKEKHGSLITGLTRWAEKQILKHADLSFAVSEVDRQHFKKLYGITTGVLPNGVDTDKFDLVADNDINNLKAKYGLNDKTILFMGSYSYRPNQEAIDFLIGSVMPRVIQSCPGAQLAVIGGDIKYKKDWLINPGTISFEEVPAFIKACNVCVAPIFSGSGTRLKILEYMAGGKPVVSTTKGAEGINVRNGVNIIIADDSINFSEKIVYLLKNQEFTKKIGNEGMQMVTNYSWKEIMQDFDAKIISLLQNRFRFIAT